MEGMGHPHQVRGQQPQYDNAGHQQPVQSAGNNSKWYKPTLESKILVGLLTVAGIIVLLVLAMGAFSNGGAGQYVKSDQYQAVFLSNGQVYFGQIDKVRGDTMVLSDIYYLQVDQQLQPDESEDGDSPQVSLAKLGNELHGPEDEMFINMSEVIFWENLKEDGDVVQAIQTHKQNGGQTNNSANPAGIEEAEE